MMPRLFPKKLFEYSGFEIKSVKGSSPHYWSLSEEWEKYTGEMQTLPPRVCFVKHKIQGGVIAIQTVDIETAQDVLGQDEKHYIEFMNSVPFGRKYLISRDELLALSNQRQKEISAKPASPEKRHIAVQAQEKSPSQKEAENGVPLKGMDKKITRRDASEISPDEKGFLEFVSQNPNMFVTQIYKSLQLSGYKGDKLKESLIEKGLIVQEETRKGVGGRLANLLVLTAKEQPASKGLP